MPGGMEEKEDCENQGFRIYWIAVTERDRRGGRIRLRNEERTNNERTREVMKMTLLENWREKAYQAERDARSEQLFWGAYFNDEKGIYEQILASDEVVTGTVRELAEKYEVSLDIMVGFLDGINDSLKQGNPIETMDENTVVSLEYDPEKLYYNMVACRAEWLYELPQWDRLLTAERRKELYRQQKSSGTIVKGKKVGRNDPCPCGSGKKYKFCCGRN